MSLRELYNSAIYAYIYVLLMTRKWTYLIVIWASLVCFDWIYVVNKISEMNKEKLHLWHVMLYEFWKGIIIGTTVKIILDVYQDHASAIQTVKKNAKFKHGDFHLGD